MEILNQLLFIKSRKPENSSSEIADNIGMPWWFPGGISGIFQPFEVLETICFNIGFIHST